MSFSIAPLLLHSEGVPSSVRQALRAAHEGPKGERGRHLESAARILHRELALDCGDARELVGLAPGTCAQSTERFDTGVQPGVDSRQSTVDSLDASGARGLSTVDC